MRTNILCTVVMVTLGIGSVTTFSLFFVEFGILWKLKLFQVPLILFMSSFLIASFTFEDAMKELFSHLEIQRFGAFVALVIGVFSLVV